jgi:hypothetical protein
MMEHARLRAEAMRRCDTGTGEGGMTEEDWKKIDELLHAFWQSLSNAVQLLTAS